MRSCILVLVISLVIHLPFPSAAIEGHVLNVGEGQSIVFSHNGRGLLIDTGHFGSAQKLAEALKRYNIHTIDGVVLTHLDADHASNLFFVKYLFPHALIYESGHRIALNEYCDACRWVAEKLDSGDWQVKTVRQHDVIEWGTISITVLWPDVPTGKSLNSMSLILHATDRKDSWLIMGDAGVEQEKTLLKNTLLPTDVDVLIVGHHGAADATGLQFLHHVNPKHAVISTDANNLRGYPDESVIKRLREHGTEVHLIYERGDFVWKSGDKITFFE